MGIVPMHLRKMPLMYWGMVPSQSGPLWLQSGGHHGLGGYLWNGRNKILPRNSMLSTKELKWGLQLIYYIKMKMRRHHLIACAATNPLPNTHGTALIVPRGRHDGPPLVVATAATLFLTLPCTIWLLILVIVVVVALSPLCYTTTSRVPVPLPLITLLPLVSPPP